MSGAKAEIVRRMLKAIEDGYVDETGEYLSDDFLFSGPTFKPIGKKEFLEIHRGLRNAMTGWRYNARDFNECNDTVTCTMRIEAVNTGEINIPLIGLIAVASTGRHVSLPEERVEMVFKGDRIIRLKSEKVPNGGISGMLNQLGIELPEMASI